MKYLRDRNLEDAQLVRVMQLNGFNIYVPETYNTPLSLLKKRCPIWIQVEDQPTCRVFELEGNMTTAEEEIEDTINTFYV